MERYPATEYRKRLGEVRRREGWKLAEPVLARGILGVLALVLVGAGLGVAWSQPAIGVIVGMVLGLAYAWIEARYSAGLHIWREDQCTIAALTEKASRDVLQSESVPDLTINELDALMCPFGDTSKSAADFLVECFGLMKQGQGYEDKLATQFSGSTGVVLGDKRNPTRHAWWGFLARMRHLNVLDKATLEPRFYVKEPLGHEVCLRLMSRGPKGSTN